MAKKAYQPEEEVIDLTELIEEGPGQGAPASGAAAGFEAALEEIEKGDGATISSPREVDPHERLDMTDMGGIDNLLESLDIPPQPRETPPPRQAAPAADDLESINSPGDPQPAAESDNLDSDLDDILASFDETPAPKPAAKPRAQAAPPPPANDDLDADLDGILSSFDEAPKAAPKAAAAKPASAPEPELNLDTELDDLLNETPKAASEPAPDIDNLQEEASPGAKGAKPAQAAEETAADDFELPPDMDDLLSGPDATPEKETAAEPLMGAAESTAEPAAATAETATSASASGEVWNALRDFAGKMGEQTANIENLTRGEAELSRRLFDCESRIDSTRSRVVALEQGAKSAAGLEELFKEGSPIHNGFTAMLDAAIGKASAEVADKMAPRDDALGERVSRLAEKVEELVSARDDELDEKIAALAQAGEADSARVAALEARVDDLGSGDLASRIATVENQVDKLANAPQDSAITEKFVEVEAKISELAAAKSEGLDEKLTELQAKIDQSASQGAELSDKIAAIAESAEAAASRVGELESKAGELAGAKYEALAEKIENLAQEGKANAEAITRAQGRLDELANQKGEDEKLTELQAKIDRAVSQGAELSDKIAAIAEGAEAAVARVDNLESKVEELAGAKDDALAEKIENLEQEGKANAEAIARAQGLLDEFANQKDESDKLAELEARVEALLAAREDLDKRLVSLTLQVDETLVGGIGASDDKLEELRAKIDELTARNETGQSARETIERFQRLEARLAALEAVGAEEHEVNEKIDQLRLSEKSVAARMDLLEKRLDDLEPNFNAQVEKAAAAAVARILHEEIGRLLGGQ